jgi:FAD synthetase
MVTGMAFGTFAIVHTGHIRFLEKAKGFCDKLIVVVARDSTVKELKGKSIIPEQQRLEVVAALKPVDEAVLGSDGPDRLAVVAKLKPDVIILGPDQDENEGELAFKLEKRGLNPKIIRVNELSKGELHKTSRIIERILSESAKAKR